MLKFVDRRHCFDSGFGFGLNDPGYLLNVFEGHARNRKALWNLIILMSISGTILSQISAMEYSDVLFSLPNRNITDNYSH